MTPAARTAAAIEILEEIARGDAPADTVLPDWFRGHRFAGSGDRRAIREQVYADVRAGALRRWLVEAAGGDPERPRLRMIAAMTRDDPDALDAIFSGAGYGPPPLTAAERVLVIALDALRDAAVPDHVRVNCPVGLYPLFENQWGGTTADELVHLNETAPVDLRVNSLVATREEARTRLAADGFDATPTPFSPAGLRGTRRGDFQQLGAFCEGLVEPQDESSQLVAMLVDATPGLRVIDYCAGAGGKALALAAASGNGAEIVACDVSGARLRVWRRRADRLGVAGVRTLTVPASAVPAELEGWADRVLIDAPCTGTGTWRRSPDLRWRTTPETIAEYARTQDRLLDTAAAMLRPGGRVIYAVCSVLAAEGRERVDAFLARHPGFVRRPASAALGDDLAARLDATDDLVLTPRRHATDGMYGAILEKRP